MSPRFVEGCIFSLVFLGEWVLADYIFGEYVQGVSKKRYFLGFRLISVLEVGFHFFRCVSESEF